MAEQYFKAKDAKDAKANVVTTANKKTRVIVFPRQGEKLYEDVMRMGRKPKITERLIKLRTEPKKEQRRITIAMRPARGRKASKAQEKIQKALEKKAAVKEARQAPVLNLEQLSMKKQVEEMIAKREAPLRAQRAIEAAKVPSKTFGIVRAPLAIEAAAVPDRPAIKGKPMKEKIIKGVEVEGMVEYTYDGLSLDALRTEAKKRGVSSKGNKPDIIANLIINDRRKAELARPAIDFPEPSIEELVAEVEGAEPTLSNKQKKKLKKAQAQKAEEAEMKAREAEKKAQKAEEEAIKREMQVINELDREIGIYADLGNVSKEELITLVGEAESHQDWSLEKRYTFVRDSLAQVAQEEQRMLELDENFRREQEEKKRAKALAKEELKQELERKLIKAKQERAFSGLVQEAKGKFIGEEKSVIPPVPKGNKKPIRSNSVLDLPNPELGDVLLTPSIEMSDKQKRDFNKQEVEQRLKRDLVLKELKQGRQDKKQLPSREEILAFEFPTLTKTQSSQLRSSELKEVEERYGLSSEGNVKERKERIKELQKQKDIIAPFGKDEFEGKLPEIDLGKPSSDLIVKKPEAIPAFEGIEEPIKTQLNAGSLMGRHHGQLKKLKKRLGRDLEKKDIKKLQKAKMFGGKLNGAGFTDTLLDLGKKGLKAAVDYGIKNPDKVLGYAKKGFEMGKSILSKKKGGALQKTSVFDALRNQ